MIFKSSNVINSNINKSLCYFIIYCIYFLHNSFLISRTDFLNIAFNEVVKYFIPFTLITFFMLINKSIIFYRNIFYFLSFHLLLACFSVNFSEDNRLYFLLLGRSPSETGFSICFLLIYFNEYIYRFKIELSKLENYCYAIFLIIAFIIILVTRSKSSLFIYILYSCFFIIRVNSRNLLIISLIILFSTVFLYNQLFLIIERFSSATILLSSRDLIWEKFIYQILSFDLTRLFFGNDFSLHSYSIDIISYDTSDAHNQFLDIINYFGLFGLSYFILYFLLLTCNNYWWRNLFITLIISPIYLTSTTTKLVYMIFYSLSILLILNFSENDK